MSTPVVVLTLVLMAFVVTISWRRKMTVPQIAASAGGYLLVMAAMAVVGVNHPYNGAMVLVAALGGGMAQWAADSHRTGDARARADAP